MPSLMHLALTMLCAVLDLWVLVFVFTIWCSAVSLARQYPCHLLSFVPLGLPTAEETNSRTRTTRGGTGGNERSVSRPCRAGDFSNVIPRALPWAFLLSPPFGAG